MNDLFSKTMGPSRGSGRTDFLVRFFSDFFDDAITDIEKKDIETRVHEIMGHSNPQISWLDRNLMSVALDKPHGKTAGFIRSHLSIAFQGSRPSVDCLYFHGVHWDGDNVPTDCLVPGYRKPLPTLPAASSE